MLGTRPEAPVLAYALLLGVWFALEAYARRAGRGRRASAEVRSPFDRGSFGAIVLGVGSALGASVAIYEVGLGDSLTAGWLVVGIAVSLAGSGLRAWSIAVLGRFFSPILRLDADQRIVREGPYRRLRHPSYTGLFFACLGAEIALGMELGIVIGAVTTFGILAYRIRLEERMLRSRFGREYEEYARSTWRLLPGLF